jgi:hypothetical protein
MKVRGSDVFYFFDFDVGVGQFDLFPTKGDVVYLAVVVFGESMQFAELTVAVFAVEP